MTTIAPPALFLDVRAFYESHGCIVSGKPTNGKEGKEYACSCPVCGGTDRASFFADTGRFCCIRGCHAHASSPYWFLRDVKGYTHLQSCEDLGIDPRESFGDRTSENPLPLFLIRDEVPCQKWQEAAQVFCHLAEKCLWGPKGETARAYLQSRGFTEPTIKAAHLGLCPDWHKAPLEDWGLDASQLGKSDDPQIKVPRGITIPWFVDGSIWKIQLRRPDGQYFEVLGSSECLYNLDSLRPGQPALLVESEFDALAGQQEASELIACIATGSTRKALTGRWIGRLLQSSQVLQGFDTDEAGNTGAEEWLRVLPEKKATRWTPWSHDINEMLQAGQSIKLWIEIGLAASQEEEPEQGEMFDTLVQEEATRLLAQMTPPALDKLGKLVLPELVERVQVFQEQSCGHCGGFDWMLDQDGYLVCPCILPLREAALQRSPSPKQAIHLCPHCKAKGNVSVGGVELVHKGANPWASTFRKTSGKPFAYVWIESQQFWLCPGCFDQWEGPSH